MKRNKVCFRRLYKSQTSLPVDAGSTPCTGPLLGHHWRDTVPIAKTLRGEGHWEKGVFQDVLSRKQKGIHKNRKQTPITGVTTPAMTGQHRDPFSGGHVAWTSASAADSSFLLQLSKWWSVST